MNAGWVLGVVLLSCFGAALLKQGSPSISALLPLAGLILLMFAALPVLEEILNFVKVLGGQAGILPERISLILQAAGLSLGAQLLADYCSDCGQKTLGDGVLFCARIGIVSLALPLVSELAESVLKTGS